MTVLKGSLIGGRWPKTNPAENRVPALRRESAENPANAGSRGPANHAPREVPLARGEPRGLRGVRAEHSRIAPPKKRDRPKVAQKWGSLAMREPARDSGIPSAGRGQVWVMPPETAGSAGRIADNGGRYERLDVRSTVCRDRGLRSDHPGPRSARCSADDGPPTGLALPMDYPRRGAPQAAV